ncbi:MAG: VanZ family protein [Gemmatimonadota bacterium]|nr:MAG: VanZ family protein [Gemmatimonadota bacterium]
MAESSHRRRLLIAIYFVALLAVTLAPIPGSTYAPALTDKLVHCLLFGGLALLLHWNLVHQSGIGRVCTATLLSVLAAGAIELLQGALPYRASDVWDLIAGAVGAVAGALTGHVAFRESIERGGRE